MGIRKFTSPGATMVGTKRESKTMVRGRLLFVTYDDENLDEGVSYAIELAKIMDEDVVMLLVRKKESTLEKIEDMMASVAFAEAGEYETAKEMAALKSDKLPPDYGMIMELVLRASKEGVHLSAERTERGLVPAIRGYVKQHARLNKVVLSPAVTEKEILTTRDLNRLVRTASRPVVTMTRKAIRDSLQKNNYAEKTIST